MIMENFNVLDVFLFYSCLDGLFCMHNYPHLSFFTLTGIFSNSIFLRWCIGIRSNLNICLQTECLSYENE